MEFSLYHCHVMCMTGIVLAQRCNWFSIPQTRKSSHGSNTCAVESRGMEVYHRTTRRVFISVYESTLNHQCWYQLSQKSSEWKLRSQLVFLPHSLHEKLAISVDQPKPLLYYLYKPCQTFQFSTALFLTYFETYFLWCLWYGAIEKKRISCMSVKRYRTCFVDAAQWIIKTCAKLHRSKGSHFGYQIHKLSLHRNGQPGISKPRVPKEG